MSGHPKNSKAQRVGRFLGRAYRSLLRQECHLKLWLLRHGVPAKGAKVCAWAIRMLVLVMLLGISITLAAFVVVLFMIARGVGRSDLSYRLREAEWRYGDEGYGYYENGVRTDFGRLFDERDDE